MILTNTKTIKWREESVSPLPFIGIIRFLCHRIKPKGIRKMFSTVSSAFWKEKEKFTVKHPYSTSEFKQILAHRNSSCRHNSVTGDSDLVLPVSLCIRKYNVTDMSDIKCQVRHLSKVEEMLTFFCLNVAKETVS